MNKITLPVAILLSTFMLVVIFVFSFYWYEIRPSRIETECSEFALKTIKTIKIGEADNLFNMIYGICMRNGGAENTFEIMKDVFAKEIK